MTAVFSVLPARFQAAAAPSVQTKGGGGTRCSDIVPAVAVLAVALGSPAATAAVQRGPGPAKPQVTQPSSCRQAPELRAACGLVVRFFHAVEARRFDVACSLLGTNLRSETGGQRCPDILAFAWETAQRWGILRARATAGQVDVLVSLDQPGQRFVRVGLQIFPDEVVSKGPPWNTTLCVRGTISLQTRGGETIYENRYVIWGRLSWGLVREYEVYQDTQSSSALDAYLATIGEPDPAAAARALAAALSTRTRRRKK